MHTLLSINNYYYRRAGAETVFLEQNRLFEQLGWKVVPFAMRHPKNLATPWDKHFVDEIEFGQEYSLWEKLVRSSKIVYSFEARKKIAALIDDIAPDVAHAHNVYHHISPSILGVLKEREIPTFLTLHDLKIACPAYTMLTGGRICERCKSGKLHNVVLHKCIKGSVGLSALIMVESAVHRLLGLYSRNVDRFVVPSRFYVEKFVEWGWPREKFVHIPNFVDVDACRSDRNVGRSFVYVGRLDRVKGLRTLIKAVSSAKVSLRIVGMGPDDKELRALAAETGGEIEFLGYQTGAALRAAISGARALVLPSEWYENAPMSVLEAYALGRPVIGARIGGIPELIREGETGILFESGSENDLVRALKTITDLEDGKVADMGGRGRAWVEETFSAERYRERLVDLYRSFGVH